jgi:hypothetical protein
MGGTQRQRLGEKSDESAPGGQPGILGRMLAGHVEPHDSTGQENRSQKGPELDPGRRYVR